ncbi:hypothetical protein [Absidia glauca]|uniref:Uncharacterized protein n=1 Tax=Absidia glauca TaxID=4829 RepID=A0A168LQ33_ABSGL|nr:hypothetical protein [Absidia glauca]
MTAATSQEDVDMIDVDDDAFSFGGDVDPVDSFAVDSVAGEQPGDNSDDGVSVDDDGGDRCRICGHKGQLSPISPLLLFKLRHSCIKPRSSNTDPNPEITTSLIIALYASPRATPVITHDDEDLAGFDSTFSNRFRRIMERDMDLEGITDSAHEDLDGIDLDSASPFNNLQSMVHLSFIFGGDDMVSRRMMQKVLYLIVLILKIADKYRDSDAVFRLPTLDSLYNFETQKKNQVPTLTTTEVTLAGSIPRTFFMNLPSTYLKQLVANPVRCRQISALPDYTPNQVSSLQQGLKWKTHPLFQQPVMTVMDWIIGSGEVFGRCYKTLFDFDEHGAVRCLVESVSSDFPISSFQQIIPKDGLTLDNCFSIYSGARAKLQEDTRALLFENNNMKRSIVGVDGVCIGTYKVKIVPLRLFTDDTSGNISKQYNKFDSWSMVCGAPPLEERNRRENTHFLGAVAGSAGLSAMDMVPRMVDDLKALEEDVVMYSAEHGEDVLVVAPLVCITADNPRHSELCGLFGLSTLYFCRFCYYLRTKKTDDYDEERLNRVYLRRTKDHYLAAAATPDRSSLLERILSCPIAAKDLGFKNKGADDLLQFQSFDPFQDAPVEILHCIFLGVVKYLVTYMVKVMLKNQAEKMARLVKALDDHAGGLGFTRSFRRNLRHCGSFLGRDFKLLIQILPFLINREFTRPGDGDMRSLNKPFGNFEDYVSRVDLAVRELTEALHEFDLEFKGASAFIKEEGDSFLPVMFGASREFSDNNDSSLALIDGRCGFFSVKQHSGPGTSVRTDENGDLLVEPSNQWYSMDDLVLEGILDLDYREPLGHYVVNRFKFGSYWLLNSGLPL